ncbi:S8 family serine peptidase [Vibrio sp. SG41-7]|uniref:S8 family serine peptidase n=1 Tax=Vibrio sp. SG41-7 TaxID=2760973 RepID=UPI0016011032|nr:S8 family serine peptidase [Vibrio sp. SG41-7]MBB1463593.1 S8 family serine peptidase [Vibrio sp. SG41-7]
MQKYRMLISFGLATLSLSAQATEWLIESNDQFDGGQFHLEEIYRFENGNRLWLGDDAHFELPPLFSSVNIHYLLPNQQLAPITQPHNQKKAIQTASEERTQHGFNIAGFNHLTDSERQCDRFRIAVLDSGIDINHNALSEVNFVDSFDATNNSEQVTDDYGHGTHVTGIIAAESNGMIQGACSSATIMPVRFLNSSGGGSVADAIKGIHWAIDHSADMINHSWSILSYSQPLYDVLRDADNRGIIQVAAAGNSNYDTAINDSYPASFSKKMPLLLSIANWDDAQSSRAVTSNYGWSSVDLAAPGTMIASLAPNNQTRVDSGTSMAAPWVSAALAMKAQANNTINDAELIAGILQQSQYQSALLGYVRDGKLLNVAQLDDVNLPLSQALSIQRQDDTIVFDGYALNEIAQILFHSAKPDSEPLDIELLAQTATTLTIRNWDLPAGWFEFISNSESSTQLGYTPETPSPKYLTSRHSDRGNTLTWSGNHYVDRYIIYKKRNGRFYELEAVLGPNNQYLDHSGEDNDIYKVRSRYDINVGERAITLSSPLSEVSDSSTLAWNSVEYADIPIGSNAILPILSEYTKPQFTLLNDDSNLVLDLRGNELVIDTDTVRSGTVQILEMTSGDVMSWPITVSDNPQWQIDYQGQPLTLFHVDSDVFSMQKLANSTLNISGQWLQSDSSLQLVLDSPNWQFGSATAVDVNNGTPVSLDTTLHSIMIVPPSEISSITPFNITIDFELNSLAQPSSSSDSRCFIATSLYQDDLPKLTFYRDFRDHLLLNLPYGHEFVDWYYENSPTWVEWFNTKPQFKSLLRHLLDVIWWAAQNPFLLFLMLLLSAVNIYRRQSANTSSTA